MSAWIPAPPLESEPAIDKTTGYSFISNIIRKQKGL
jgi:hypothetical protein